MAVAVQFQLFTSFLAVVREMSAPGGNLVREDCLLLTMSVFNRLLWVSYQPFKRIFVFGSLMGTESDKKNCENLSVLMRLCLGCSDHLFYPQ